MAFQQFFIKNTFIFVPSQTDEETRDKAEARRCKSAPPKMRSPSPPEGDDGARKTEHIIAADIEIVGQDVEASDSGEADEQGEEEVSEVEDITGPSLMPSHKAAEPQIRPSVLRRQQERMIDQFLDGEISKVRAEKWGALSRRLVEFCTQKYSLSALRIDLLVPRRRFGDQQAMLDAYCEFHRTDRGHDERDEEERYAQGERRDDGDMGGNEGCTQSGRSRFVLCCHTISKSI